MPDTHLQGDRASDAIAERVGAFELEPVKESGGIVGHRFECQRAIDIRRVSVRLLLDGDGLPSVRERRQNRCEGSIDGVQAAVKEHQRSADAVNLVQYICKPFTEA